MGGGTGVGWCAAGDKHGVDDDDDDDCVGDSMYIRLRRMSPEVGPKPKEDEMVICRTHNKRLKNLSLHHTNWDDNA